MLQLPRCNKEVKLDFWSMVAIFVNVFLGRTPALFWYGCAFFHLMHCSVKHPVLNLIICICVF